LKNIFTVGDLSLQDYFTQLLRLVYRLIFLLAAEDRGLLHTPNTTITAKKLYTEGYSLDNLRQNAVRRAAWDRHHDRWEGLLVVFSALARGEAKLGLPALGGLFSPDALPDLEQASLSNRTLMEAIYRLAWLKEDARLVPINWRDMETEELGSVYESLLELPPRLNGSTGWKFTFAEGLEAKGNARKTTGSYYTPDSLVQALLDSALDPVLDRVEAESDDPVKGLLSITAIDPACGSGHFLLAAARRIASRVARIRAGGVASAEDYRHALRDVVRSCIYGVDRNPMAVELTKVALWIETVEPGKPLGFLDANIRCGDSLVGILDLKMLEDGIPDTAYKPLTGDDKDICKALKEKNKANSEAIQHTLFGGQGQQNKQAQKAYLDAMPEDTLQDVEAKKKAFKQALQDPDRIQQELKANLYVAAFFTPKTPETIASIPTNEDFSRLAQDVKPREGILQTVEAVTKEAVAFHWPVEFPDIIVRGGFDVVLGNPPWERIKLQEQEFFASRDPEISSAPNTAARQKLIKALQNSEKGTRERKLFEEFEATKRLTEASSVFIRESGRYPLTGRGDVNTYAIFTEHFKDLTSPRGRAGIIVPTGIATDATTAPFFAALVEKKQLVRLVSFENESFIFPSVHHSFRFCLLTLASTVKDNPEFYFFLRDTAQLAEAERRFSLSPNQIAQINPNTKTAPVFRSRTDAELAAKVYKNVPVLINESRGREGNAWNLSFLTMYHMSNDSNLFLTAEQLNHKEEQDYAPLYEAKMIHLFDHRWATYDGTNSRDCTIDEKKNHTFESIPRYWISKSEVTNRLTSKGWNRGWFMGWRDITSITNERTVIASAFPRVGIGNNLPIMLFDQHQDVQKLAALLGCLSSMTFDFFARHKVGGNHLNFFIYQQLPVLPPSAYSEADLNLIVPHVLELIYTSHSMEPFARDLGFDGPPFAWDENRRALLRAELDAWYARAYGLTRDELRYILDPADVMGEDYPSETFRVLKMREISALGEYRTQRLVLEAWDRMESGTVQATAAVATQIDLTTLPDGAWEQSSSDGAILPQLAAIIKTLPGPTPAWKVRLAALYALEPRYLTNRLTGAEQGQWLRLVGSAATPHTGTNVATLISQINTAWGQAVAQLRGMNVIDENTATQTWAPGAGINSLPDGMIDGWPSGRAGFVLQALEAINFNDVTTDLSTELQNWVTSHVAA
jgi:type I restriction-modification system DNA methylase subunit